MALNACKTIQVDRQGREQIEHGTPLFPIACYHDNISEREVAWHWHEELEVLVVESGTVRVAANGEDCLLHAGEGVFIQTGALHGVWPASGEVCRIHSLVFHPRLVGGSLDSIFWQKYLEPLLSDSSISMIRLDPCVSWGNEACEDIESAWQLCVKEEDGYEFRVRDRLSHLLFTLGKSRQLMEQKPSRKARRDGERIKIMLQYIQDHLDQPLSLADIARSAHLSENECLRCFNRMIGSTPIRYIRELRLQKAVSLLVQTDGRISDIAAKCGFLEMSYFARVFRERNGCTPGEYRKRYGTMPKESL